MPAATTTQAAKATPAAAETQAATITPAAPTINVAITTQAATTTPAAATTQAAIATARERVRRQTFVGSKVHNPEVFYIRQIFNYYL